MPPLATPNGMFQLCGAWSRRRQHTHAPYPAARAAAPTPLCASPRSSTAVLSPPSGGGALACLPRPALRPAPARSRGAISYIYDTLPHLPYSCTAKMRWTTGWRELDRQSQATPAPTDAQWQKSGYRPVHRTYRERGKRGDRGGYEVNARGRPGPAQRMMSHSSHTCGPSRPMLTDRTEISAVVSSSMPCRS